MPVYVPYKRPDQTRQGRLARLNIGRKENNQGYTTAAKNQDKTQSQSLFRKKKQGAAQTS